MVSTTGFFVKLQQIYQQKAGEDRVIFKGILDAIKSVRKMIYKFLLVFIFIYFI
jgi:hypothetical protein